MKKNYFFFFLLLSQFIFGQNCVTAISGEHFFDLEQVTNEVLLFSPIEQGKIWCSSRSGLYEIDTKTGQKITFQQKFKLYGVSNTDKYGCFKDSTANYYWVTTKDTIYRYDLPTLNVKKYKNQYNVTAVAQTNQYIYFASQQQILFYDRQKDKLSVLFDSPPFTVNGMVKHPSKETIYFNPRTYLNPSNNTVQNCSEDEIKVEPTKFLNNTALEDWWYIDEIKKEKWVQENFNVKVAHDMPMPCMNSPSNYIEDKDGFWLLGYNAICFFSKKEKQLFQIDYTFLPCWSSSRESALLIDDCNLYFCKWQKVVAVSKTFLRSKMTHYDYKQLEAEQVICDATYPTVLRENISETWETIYGLQIAYDDCLKTKYPECDKRNPNRLFSNFLTILARKEAPILKTSIKEAVKKGTFPKKWLPSISYIFREPADKGDVQATVDWITILETNYGKLFSSYDSIFFEKCKVANNQLLALEQKNIAEDELLWQKAMIYEVLERPYKCYDCFKHTLAQKELEILIEKYPKSKWADNAKFNLLNFVGQFRDKEVSKDYEDILKKYPDTDLKPVLYQTISMWCYMIQSQYKTVKEQKDNFKKILKYAELYKNYPIKDTTYTYPWADTNIEIATNSIEVLSMEYDLSLAKKQFFTEEAIPYKLKIKNTGKKNKTIKLLDCEKQPDVKIKIEQVNEKDKPSEKFSSFCEALTPSKCKSDTLVLSPGNSYTYSGALDNFYYKSDFKGALKFTRPGSYSIYICDERDRPLSEKVVFQIFSK
jgi:hypothetical protein